MTTTPDDVQLIHDLHQRGWSAQRTADILDMPLPDILAALPKPKGRDRAEDALWLLDCGEHPAHVARRCGYPTVDAMEKALRRMGHTTTLGAAA